MITYTFKEFFSEDFDLTEDCSLPSKLEVVVFWTIIFVIGVGSA